MVSFRMRDIGKALQNARFEDVAKRFWARTEWKDNGCREWLGACHEFGYGVVGIGKLTLKTHRVAWWLTNGPIPKGLFVLHKCDNPPCVNPEHLFLGTDWDNQRDAMRKGRHKGPPHYLGARNPAAKMTAKRVRELRKVVAEGMSWSQAARAFGIAKTTVGHIVHRRKWKHV